MRNRGFKNLLSMQQKLAAGERPVGEVLKSMSLIFAGALLILPGFFTDFLGLLLLLPPVQKLIMLRLMPQLGFYRASGGGFRAGNEDGHTFDGEFQRKNDAPKRLEDRERDDR